MVIHDHRARELQAIIDRIESPGLIVEAIKQLRPLADAAASVSPEMAVTALRPLVERHESDALVGYLAVYALGAVRSPAADAVLVEALDGSELGLAVHAAWALSRRRPIPEAVASLVTLAGRGGFAQMMAELALEAWFREMPELIWRTGRSVPERMWALSKQPDPGVVKPSHQAGLRIAQILMQGRVDAALSAPGSGDGGGLITLQVGLTKELAAHDGVSDVYLVTRRVDDGSDRFVSATEQIAPGGTLARLDFGQRGYVPIAEMWSMRADLEHRLREFLLDEGPFDALHLRFADVGTFAAARLADELGIPVFFTLAPDPHIVIARAEREGSLTRDGFADADLEHHFLFRAWLVDWMLSRAERIALLPREGLERQLEELMDVDVAADPGRFRIIAEGVDYDRALAARRSVSGLPLSGEHPTVLADLERMISQLPASRRGLPVILSVGRLNPIKGMSRAVRAWVTDDSIRERFNLLIVGGDLDNPSPGELEVLESICDAAGLGPSAGLLLMGGRSHDDVALLMAAAREGLEGSVGGGGIYVSASEKEEFGLAIVEALAAGLPVVAPMVGGPATYLEHEFTGYLADTTKPEAIQRALAWADTARSSEVRADAARRMVRSKYSLSAMADELVDLYGLDDRKRSTA